MIKDVYNWLMVAGVPQKGTPQQFELFHNLVLEELEETTNAFRDKSKEDMIDGFVDLMWVILNGSYMMGITLDDLQNKIDRVSYSNWTKFCTIENNAVETVEAYKNGTHPSKLGQPVEAYYEKVGDFYIIKRVSDNKVLKSLDFVEP